MSQYKKAILIISLILIVDQIVKIWVKTHMVLGQEYHILGNWFIIHFTENNGMAFGLELGGETGKVILTLFRVIAASAIIWYLNYLIKNNAPTGLVICISLIFAGAVGNIFDSAFYGMIFNNSYYNVAKIFPESGGYSSFLHGKVVDMLYFPIIKGNYPHWFPINAGERFIFFRPVFNIADSSITIGVTILLIFQKSYFKNIK